ncbi:hypothetical protein V6N13_072402 [Hibiscus sabdariffa]|uniref:Uncharacterized protein n=1 Tax=Hibiscus sabdariffa TaxID=183260 RepID=A0ABR2R7N8_9ROSI
MVAITVHNDETLFAFVKQVSTLIEMIKQIQQPRQEQAVQTSTVSCIFFEGPQSKGKANANEQCKAITLRSGTIVGKSSIDLEVENEEMASIDEVQIEVDV